ncbi:ABC transporter substrate-binding protein [Roseospira marina]|uniref:ABC transporter substrate-binding protein n=1 Tax=Roseospira marina TaxID=140057 RepID=A0A5M6II06_9PROT|nr:ABC transporter substrate-binding protein [Roseospira marina]KAA5607597.1 ABC transporter substrate-binding protein [Roseospira marina]MBB4312208.1 peptide/nickel transport system substrate-binding protein [Roseospira marina]MBB5085776.1 peptide/nickel transport system substrate-binding protein [Roseospira marina]
MKRNTVCAAAVAGLMTAFGPVAATQAETPPNMAVIAWHLDELITMDPAEAYEFAGAEVIANLYDRLVYYDIDNTDDIKGGIAESWVVSEDGKTFTFTIRDGVTFHSGNPVTADDVAWSLQRVVTLNKGPAFILAEFGLTAENVVEKVRATDPHTLVLETDQRYAPSFVLNCLGSWVSSVLDRKTVMAHDENGDMGNAWLKTHEAGSGPFTLSAWRPNEVVLLDRFEDYVRGAPAMQRIALRHVPESGPQRLMLEKGDADIARNLGPEDLAALKENPEISLRSIPQGAVTYLGLNQKNPNLAKPEVRQALKWLVDYDGIERHILQGTKVKHQTFLPAGFLGALDEAPYSLNLDKARALLAEAGLEDGFTVTMDTRNTFPTSDIAQALQATWAQAGITLELLPGDNKQTLTKYRARQHDIYIGYWAPDYLDPHGNASGFAWNPDNGDDSPYRLLAWRNAWDIPEYTARTEAALAESDQDARRQMYQDLQRDFLAESPFVIMFQNIRVVAEREGVSGFEVGPNFDVVYYRNITKTAE